MTPDAGGRAQWKLQYLQSIVKSAVSYTPYICITETWAKSYHTDAQFHIPHYNIYRADRAGRTRGGVLTYVHDNLIVSESQSFCNQYCEALVITVESEKTLIMTVYRPPDTPLNKFKETVEFLYRALQTKDDSWVKIITGDFNFPNICWEDNHITPGTSRENNESATLLTDLLECNFLAQYIDQPTRNHNILDLFITNDQTLAHETSIVPSLISDHSIITVTFPFNIGLDSGHSEQKPYSYLNGFSNLNMSKCDYEAVANHIREINWDYLHEICPIADFPELFRLIVLQIVTLHTTEKSKPKPANKAPGQYRLSRKRRRITARLKAITSHNPNSPMITTLKSQLNVIELQIRNQIRATIDKAESKALSVMKTNPKYFYSYAKRFAKTKSRIGPLKQDSGEYTNIPSVMGELLQDQFSSVFSNPAAPEKIIPPLHLPEHTLETISFDPSDIAAAIAEISLDSASGEDEFPAILLKKCSSEVSYPIYLIWKDSLREGSIHSMFKSQLICPVFKKGSKALAENYRPISLTSHIIKIFERVVRNHIVNHLEHNNLLINNQHGFRKGKSCLSELLDHYTEIVNSFNEGSDTDAIFLDFAKAFDKVDHDVLLRKLQNLGITGELHNWIRSFLTNRVQKVTVDGFHSRLVAVLSGVPQGTVLGPILFLIYINDINEHIQHSSLRSFADDTRILKRIEGHADMHKLQRDLNNVIEWSRINNMVLHEKKFEFIQHNLPNQAMAELLELPFVAFDQCYTTSDGTVLQPVSSVRDLGIQVTPNLSWSTHIQHIAKKASQAASWILSVFRHRDHHTMLTIYKSLIRSHLEYCCPLWNPHNNTTNIKILENIQRSFTARINGYSDINYWDRLASLKLMSLQRRRERYIIIYMWKMKEGLVPNHTSIQWYYNERTGIRAMVPKIPRYKSRLHIYENSFNVIGPRLWNIIPTRCTTCPYLGSFKTMLQPFLNGIPDLPPVGNYTCKNSNSLLDWAIDGGRQC